MSVFKKLNSSPSLASFDRSRDRSRTILIVDPIMGIFKFLGPRWRVEGMEYSTNVFTPMILVYSDGDFHM